MPRRILEGYVTSDKQDKTVTVRVERRFMHPMYKKYVKRSDKYRAHDETNSAKTGQLVQIRECRPVSRNKTWEIVTGSKQDDGAADDSTGQKAGAGNTKSKASGQSANTGTSSAKSSATGQGKSTASGAAKKDEAGKSASSAKSRAGKDGSSESGASQTDDSKSTS